MKTTSNLSFCYMMLHISIGESSDSAFSNGETSLSCITMRSSV